MNRPDAILWNVNDWIAATCRMTDNAYVAYHKLCMFAYRDGGKLPNDPKTLARWLGWSQKKFAKVWPEIERYFEVDGDVILQKRCQNEYKKAQKYIEQRSQAGKASALKRKKTGSTTVATEVDSRANNVNVNNKKEKQQQDIYINTPRARDGAAAALLDDVRQIFGAPESSGWIVTQEAAAWLQAGYDPAAIRELAHGLAERRRAKGQGPPGSPRYLTPILAEHLAAPTHNGAMSGAATETLCEAEQARRKRWREARDKARRDGRDAPHFDTFEGGPIIEQRTGTHD